MSGPWQRGQRYACLDPTDGESPVACCKPNWTSEKVMFHSQDVRIPVCMHHMYKNHVSLHKILRKVSTADGTLRFCLKLMMLYLPGCEKWQLWGVLWALEGKAGLECMICCLCGLKPKKSSCWALLDSTVSQHAAESGGSWQILTDLTRLLQELSSSDYFHYMLVAFIC